MIRLARGDSYTLYLNRIYHRMLPWTTNIKTLLPMLLRLFIHVISFTSKSFMFTCFHMLYMLSHALIIMLTLLYIIYIYDIATREISAIWWVGTHHTRKVLYACDRLGTLLSLVTVFFISLFIHLFYYLVQAGHVLFCYLSQAGHVCFLSQAGHAGNVISKQELIWNQELISNQDVVTSTVLPFC